jgi:hypothetical protein
MVLASAEGWELRQEDVDVILRGPGRLEIVFAHFDAAKVERPEGLPPELIGRTRQQGWAYRLDEATTLELISIWEVEAEASRQHLLHANTRIVWELPDAIAQALHALGQAPGTAED